MKTFIKLISYGLVGCLSFSSLKAVNVEETFDYARHVEQTQGPIVTLTQAAYEGLLADTNSSKIAQFHAALKNKPTLTGLKASDIKWKKNILKKILKPLKDSPLIVLMLDGCTFKAADIEALATQLPACLQELSLARTNLNDFYFQGLGKSLAALRKIDLSYSGLSDFGTPLLKILIESSDRLEELNLSHVGLGAASGDILLQAVKNRKKLQILALEGTPLNTLPVGVEITNTLDQLCFEEELKASTLDGNGQYSLRQLYTGQNTSLRLKWSDFNEASLSSLCRALKKSGEKLNSIYFEGLKLSTEQGPLLAELLSLASLEARYLAGLSFSSCELPENFLRMLGQSPLSDKVTNLTFTKCHLGAAVRYFIWPHLQCLYLQENNITDADMKAIAPSLRECKELRHLYLDGNPLTWEGIAMIADLFPQPKKDSYSNKSLSVKKTPFAAMMATINQSNICYQ